MEKNNGAWGAAFVLGLLVIFFSVFIFTKADAQEDEIWDDPYPAQIIKEIQQSGELPDQDYDYDELGPFHLKVAQAVIVPRPEMEMQVTPSVVTEDEVSEEEKQSPENLQFMCKAVNGDGCLKTGMQCAQFSQSAVSALACWDGYYDCLGSIKHSCEEEHIIEEEDAASD